MEELHLTVSIPEEMGWNRLFHPQLKKRLWFVYRPRLIFLWALGTLVISGSKVLEYYDDFAAGRATVLVKFQQKKNGVRQCGLGYLTCPFLCLVLRNEQ
jgi:hypothetical protein